MADEPLITAMLASMPPYICRCGYEMGVPLNKDASWKEAMDAGDHGCQPGRCARLPPEPERPIVCSSCRAPLERKDLDSHRCADGRMESQ